MRYIEIDNITFVTFEGKSILIKDLRAIPEYTDLSNYKTQKDDDVDEIISRREYYGDNSESRSYSIVEKNNAKFDESNYTMNLLSEIIIPVVN